MSTWRKGREVRVADTRAEEVSLRWDGWDEVRGPSAPTPPPRSGEGSGHVAWATFARAVGVDVPGDATRAEIISALVDAGVVGEES